ncbi:MAG TPA: hypothetical protein VJN44_00250 [Roseateles sp.]|nr:hypothetical protein [Roseateles sp.]
MFFFSFSWRRLAAALAAFMALLAPLSAALAQNPQQLVKPPQAQAWIDIATFSGMGMPPMGAGSPSMGAALGTLFGGAAKSGNSFGQTQSGGGGRWVDVTLYSRSNPQLAEAQQAVPGGFLPAPLKLQAPRHVPTLAEAPEERDSEPPPYERPKGRLLMYWGCDKNIRPGQPRVLDMASATPAELAKFFVARRATQRGAHSAAGRPVWPSRDDTRMLPAQASLVGEHGFSGSGIPEGFRFQIPAAQDLMPALALQQRRIDGGATELSWNAIPSARAYFAAAMGAGASEGDMVIWTSSELPDNGFGLVDYQTNAAVDRWLKEQVLLAPSTTQCTVPKGVFKGEGAMLRMIAHGSELNLVHPPRPADPKQPWEQVWAAKLRVKSVATALLDMDQGLAAGGAMPRAAEDAGAAEASAQPAAAEKDDKKIKPLELLRGLLGR